MLIPVEKEFLLQIAGFVPVLVQQPPASSSPACPNGVPIAFYTTSTDTLD